MTLPELLLVVALFALLAALALPSLAQMAAVSSVRVDAERLLASVQLARAHAVREGTPVLLCPRASAAGERCGRDYDAGWQLLRDAAAPQDGPVLLREEPPAAGLRIRRSDGRRAVAAALRFRADGATGRGATFRFCLPPSLEATGWRLVVSATGRPRLDRDSAECPP